jgi:hypothetical protein
VVAIAARGNSSAALTADGKVVVWGSSFYNQTNVPPSVSNAVAVAVGGDADATAVFALKPDGSLIAWGSSGFGQTTMPSGLSNVVAISAGNYPILVLKADGTVVEWGDYISTNIPAQLPRVSSIAAGGYHTLALIGDGSSALDAPAMSLSRLGNGASISLPTKRGRVYMLEYKNSLIDSNWTPLPLAVGIGGVQTLSDSTANWNQRFYRVRQW